MTESHRVRRARGLRQQAGLAERRIWEMVGGSRLDGLKFRRQDPVGRYTADFSCPSLRLILEIDGGIHRLDDVAARDAERQLALEELGWTVLRFTNEQALKEPHLITDAIRRHANPGKADPHPPADEAGGPLPLPSGEG